MTRVRPRVVLATRNPHKAREIVALYAHLGVEFITLDQWPELIEVPEKGETYAENASAKAVAAARATGLPALADDSGIEVDVLGGAPGVRSRRLLGEEARDADRTAHLLRLLGDVPEDRRTARFRAAVAVASPDGTVRVFEGTCEGRVAPSPRGAGGFGYDPIFIPSGDHRTMAELSLPEKNQISHRARALRAAEPYLRSLVDSGSERTVTAREEPSAPGANSETRRAREQGDEDLPGGFRRER